MPEPTATPRQIVGFVLILGAALVSIPLKDTQYLQISACAMSSLIGLFLLLKGGRRV